MQMAVVKNQKFQNFEKVRNLLKKTPPKKDSLVILPEMFATGYLPSHCAQEAENFSNSQEPTVLFLQEISNQTQCHVLGGGIGKTDDGLVNHTGLYSPHSQTGTEAAGYNKIHPFFPEQEYGFIAGQNPTVFQLNHWNIAPTICYDLRFPELYKQISKLFYTKSNKQKLVTVQAAWPAIRNEDFETLLIQRARENNTFIAAVNYTTPQPSNKENPEEIYMGNSMIVSPEGNVVAGQKKYEEIVIEAEI